MDIESTSDYQLDKNTDQDSALNFEFLRARGIQLVQQYAGTTWTDYNLHDPGVTILEYLCYAITDLAYRTSFNIEDLLTEKDGTIDYGKNLFYTKKEILTTNPVLENDLRKRVIDRVPEVYNVWITPVSSTATSDYIKGLYRVFIQPTNDDIQESLEHHTPEEQDVFRKQIINKVKNVLDTARNVGHDYESYQVLEPCDVRIEAEIVVDRHSMHEELLAQVYDVLVRTLNPPINFYTESTLRERGMSTDEIYQGPALAHGFIVDEEMTAKIAIVDPSDLTKAVLSVEGVKLLRKLVVTIDGEPYEHKPFYLEHNRFPRFLFNLDAPAIRLFSDSYEVPVKHTIFTSLLHKKLDANKRKYIRGYNDAVSDIIKGEYRDVAAYHSMQDLFPPVYRLNIKGLETERAARSEQHLHTRIANAKAKQLKGYLMLFEQILANYLTQLGNIGEILSPSLKIGGKHHTYFAQPLYDVPAAGNILSDFMKPGVNPTQGDWERFREDDNNGYAQLLEKIIESDDTFRERKKRLLDHMLSRFNINLLKYPLQIYDRLYKPQGESEQYIELKWKADILKNVVSLTANRNQGSAYTTNDDDVAGFETWMNTLLYLNNGSRKRMANAFRQWADSGKLKIGKKDASPTTASPLTTYEVNWDGQRLDMLITEEEKQRLLENREEPIHDEERKEPSQHPEHISVPGRSVFFLKEGINTANYRIGPEINGKGFVVLYREPKDRQWTRIGKYTTRDKASAALSGFINTLQSISIETEGYHLVEHILLRPALSSPSFGFEFRDEKGEIVFSNNQWFTFDARKQVLQSILDLAMAEDPDIDELRSLLNNTTVLLKGREASSEEAYGQFAKRLIASLRTSQTGGRLVYPCFTNVVQRTDGTVMREDFFRFRMTVVFPAWPARFQDKAFRNFAENLFIENSPAHIKLNFLWLSVNAMEAFENSYYHWMETNRAKDLAAKERATGELISILNEVQR